MATNPTRLNIKSRQPPAKIVIIYENLYENISQKY